MVIWFWEELLRYLIISYRCSLRGVDCDSAMKPPGEGVRQGQKLSEANNQGAMRELGVLQYMNKRDIGSTANPEVLANIFQFILIYKHLHVHISS